MEAIEKSGQWACHFPRDSSQFPVIPFSGLGEELGKSIVWLDERKTRGGHLEATRKYGCIVVTRRVAALDPRAGQTAILGRPAPRSWLILPGGVSGGAITAQSSRADARSSGLKFTW